MSDAETLKRIYQVDARTLGIEWADGQDHQFPVRMLRLACTCAGCIHEWSGEQLLKPDEVADDVHPVSISNTGHYGLRFSWSDGHDSGIYTFEHLRRLGDNLDASGAS